MSKEYRGGLHLRLKMTCRDVKTVKWDESYRQSQHGEHFMNANRFYQQFSSVPGYYDSNVYSGVRRNAYEVFFENSSSSYAGSSTASDWTYRSNASPFTPEKNEEHSTRSSPFPSAPFWSSSPFTPEKNEEHSTRSSPFPSAPFWSSSPFSSVPVRSSSPFPSVPSRSSSPFPSAPFWSKKSSLSGRESKPVCGLCFQNEGPKSSFYNSHQLKDASGNVVCPVLQKHVCEYCGATGTQAHTISYCPKLREMGVKPKSAVSLKNTLHNSCGRIRHFK